MLNILRIITIILWLFNAIILIITGGTLTTFMGVALFILLALHNFKDIISDR